MDMKKAGLKFLAVIGSAMIMGSGVGIVISGWKIFEGIMEGFDEAE